MELIIKISYKNAKQSLLLPIQGKIKIEFENQKFNLQSICDFFFIGQTSQNLCIMYDQKSDSTLKYFAIAFIYLISSRKFIRNSYYKYANIDLIIIIIRQIHSNSLFMSDNIVFEASTSLNNRFQNISCNKTQDMKEQKEIQFVSQFLQLDNKKQEEITMKQQENQYKQEIDMRNSSDTLQQPSSNLQNSSQIKKTKSRFHNFQKHLVITLKNNISLNKNHSKNDVTSTLANEMWTIFIDSNYYCKRILHFLFGVITFNKQHQIAQRKNKIFPAFMEISETYSEKAIEQAQQYLRRQVCRQGKKIIAKKVIFKRRMQNSEEFQKYFSSFLEQIQNGAISKRLPKPSKINFIDKMKDEQKVHL